MNIEMFKTIWNESDLVEQEEESFLKVVNFIEKIKPDIIAEIGVKKGGSLNFWKHLISENGFVIGIDSDDLINFNDDKIKFIKGNSTHNITYQRFNEILNGKKLDVLYIDGSHKYSDTKSDFYTYGWHVKKNGYIVFHDAFLDSEGYDIGSTKHLVQEIKNRCGLYWNHVYTLEEHTGTAIFKII